MATIDYLGSLRDDGAALAAAAGKGLHPPVPACEGWTVADLLRWYQQGLAELVTVLEDADLGTRVWTFHRPDQTAAFWHRRMERSGDPALLPRVRELAAAATQ